ncbi:MAG: Helicase DnaB, partial [Campylobacterota bacterium]|nr:Helicase DnaB [Campylobacterota bacterium]
MQQLIYSEAFERAILSSIIYEPAIFKEVLEAGLRSEDFYIPFHQVLF